MTRLHFRLTNIRNQMELLENPHMRAVYENVRNTSDAHDAALFVDVKALIVSPVGTIAQQRHHLDWCETYLADKTMRTLAMPTLQHCLDAGLRTVRICLPASKHAIKVIEPVHGELIVYGHRRRNTRSSSIVDNDSESTVITTTEDVSKMLSIDGGNVRIEGVTFDCAHVRTGILLRRGRLVLVDCHFVGDATRSNTKCAITIALPTVVQTDVTMSSDVVVELINCTVRYFGVGINVGRPGKDSKAKVHVRLDSTQISACDTAIETIDDACSVVHMEGDTVLGPNRWYGCAVTRSIPLDGAAVKELYTDVDSAAVPSVTGACSFVDNALGNMVRFNYTANRLFEDDRSGSPQISSTTEFAMPASPRRCVKSDALATLRNGDDRMSESDDAEEPILLSESESELELSSSVIMVDDST